jgi:hypothetical protein
MQGDSAFPVLIAGNLFIKEIGDTELDEVNKARNQNWLQFVKSVIEGSQYCVLFVTLPIILSESTHKSPAHPVRSIQAVGHLKHC